MKYNFALTYCLIIMSCSLGLNVYLGLQLKGPSVAPKFIGDTLKPFPGTDLSGSLHSVQFDRHRSTILYVMSPSCSFCKKNHQEIVGLAKQFPSTQFVAISTREQGLAKYLSEFSMPFPVYLPAKGALSDDLLNATPRTLLVSPRGVIEGAWTGRYTDAYRQDVIAKLGKYSR
jgi:hypothetical protein